MDNKDEKTFTDLFASTALEETNNEPTKTFSDILNNNIINETKKNENESTTLEQLNLEKEKLIEPLPSLSFGNIFDNKEEINIEDFQENDLTNTEEQISQSTIKNNLFQEEQKNEENPFFETNAPLDNIFNNKENKIELINQDEIPNKESIPANNEELDFSQNPFINSEETAIKNKIDYEEEKKSKENPFFNVQSKNTEEQIASNVTVIPNQKENSDKKETTVQKELTTTSSASPFFEEEKKSEENPFFQNQLNLIENQVPSTPKTNIDSTKSKHYNVKIVKKKEPLIKFILGVLSYALFIWLLLIGVTLLIYVLDIKIRAAKGDYSSPTFNAYVVLTGSMLPEIQVKDVVVTKKVEASELKKGDVITFASADTRFLGTIITHRIIKKNPPTETTGYTFQTQGDNNNVADSALVPENNIYGKVILKIPKLGYLQEFLATDGGWIIVILIPCLTVISYDTVKLIKGLKRKKYKNIKVQK